MSKGTGSKTAATGAGRSGRGRNSSTKAQASAAKALGAQFAKQAITQLTNPKAPLNQGRTVRYLRSGHIQLKQSVAERALSGGWSASRQKVFRNNAEDAYFRAVVRAPSVRKAIRSAPGLDALREVAVRVKSAE